MTVVQNRELTPDGKGAANVKIEVRVGGTPAATSSLTGSVVAIARAVSDASGNWSLDLTPNSQLQPLGTWYVFRRIYPAALGAQRVEQYGVVPDSATPLSYEAIIVSEPEAPLLTDSELSSHLVHGDPHEQYLRKEEADALYGVGTTAPVGPIVHTDVTDWNAATRAIRLDELAAPTTEVFMGNQPVGGVANGTDPTDALNVSQLDGHRADGADPHAAAGYMRIAVGTATGPPTTGTFRENQLAVSGDRRLWLCVTAGSPGSWQPAFTKVTVSAVRPTAPQIGDVHIKPVS